MVRKTKQDVNLAENQLVKKKRGRPKKNELPEALPPRKVKTETETNNNGMFSLDEPPHFLSIGENELFNVIIGVKTQKYKIGDVFGLQISKIVHGKVYFSLKVLDKGFGLC